MMQIRLEGRGGQGVVLGADVIGRTLVGVGKYALKIPVYGTSRRGERVTAFMRVGETPILDRSEVYEPDFVVMFDSKTEVKDAAHGLNPEGALLLNSSLSPDQVEPVCRSISTVDADAISQEVYGHRPIQLTNMAMIGALSKVTDLFTFEQLEAEINAVFQGRNKELSLQAARLGYERARSITADAVEPIPAHPVQGGLRASALPASPRVDCLKLKNAETASWRTTDPVIDTDKCIGCGQCILLCPEGTMQLVDGKATIAYEYCKGCGICIEVCPVQAITMVKNGQEVS